MKDHTDRAVPRVAITAICTALFIVFAWVPTMTLWINPWLYEGVVYPSHEWKKAWVLSSWFGFAPIMVAFAYAFTTMYRAMRRDEREREASRAARSAWYRNETHEARRLP
ncbi:hypothetical protein [Pseudomonas sp. Marseille-QA0892]